MLFFFFSIAIAPSSQDHFAFTWKGQQWTFTVFPQGSIHSPSICYGLVARGLQLWPKPVSVHLFHYIHNIMLTCESLSDLEQAAEILIPHLEQQGWAVKCTEVQEPRFSVKFLDVTWAGKTKVTPEAVSDTIQAFLHPTSLPQLQSFGGLLDYWRHYIPHLA